MRSAVAEIIGILESHKDFVEVGADVAFDAIDERCAAPQSGRQFGDRTSANRLIGLKALADENLSGKDIIVVIVDLGLNKNDIESKPKGKFGGGEEVSLCEPPVAAPAIASVRSAARRFGSRRAWRRSS